MAESELYTEFILELYKNPLNYGTLDKPDLHANAYNPLCGDSVELFIKLDAGGKKIDEIKYSGKGCAISQVSASLLTEKLKGKTLAEAAKLGKEDILKMIRIDLSKNPSRLKCALLPLEVLRKAMR